MSSTQRFDGEAIVVTGGGSGIGRDTAIAFAEEGAGVVVADVDAESGESTAKQIETDTPGSATFVETDVTDDEAVQAMVDTAVENYGGLDVAVNNAGVGGQFEATEVIDESDWQRILDVNLTGVWRCMRHEIPEMLEGGGSIVNVASILGKVGTEGAPAYTASKHGVLGLTKTAALEHATDDVRVNAVCPGYVQTQMLDDAGVTADEEMLQEVRAAHAMQRLGEGREIADAITWLGSDEASFTTGEALVVDGGYLAR